MVWNENEHFGLFFSFFLYSWIRLYIQLPIYIPADSGMFVDQNNKTKKKNVSIKYFSVSNHSTENTFKSCASYNDVKSNLFFVLVWFRSLSSFRFSIEWVNTCMLWSKQANEAIAVNLKSVVVYSFGNKKKIVPS